MRVCFLISRLVIAFALWPALRNVGQVKGNDGKVSGGKCLATPCLDWRLPGHFLEPECLVHVVVIFPLCRFMVLVSASFSAPRAALAHTYDGRTKGSN